MIDVKPTNLKLQQRARRTIRDVCGDRCRQSDVELDNVLQACDRSVKLAAAHIYLGTSVEDAKLRLREADELLAKLLKTPKEHDKIGHGLVNYVLCVDGGGSKCQAVLLSKDGAEGTGEAGPCNP